MGVYWIVILQSIFKGVFMFPKLDFLFNVALYACFAYIGLIIANVLFHFINTLLG